MTTVVPVLLYHAVGNDPSGWIAPFTVSPDTFRRHLELVAASGRVALSIEELCLALNGDLPLRQPAVVITFDDGFSDLADVVTTELANWRLPATMYLTTGFIDGRSPGGDLMLSWNGVRELVDAGHDIGGHSITHPELDTVGRRGAHTEIVDCRHELQDRTGLPIRSFAYPHGYSSRAVRQIVRDAGYESACGVRNAFSHDQDARFSIARLTITAETSDAALNRWLAGEGAQPAAPGERLATRAWRTYRRARAWSGGRSRS